MNTLLTKRAMLKGSALGLGLAILLGACTDSRDFRGLQLAEAPGTRIASSVRLINGCPTQYPDFRPGGTRVAPALAAPLIGLGVDFALNAVEAGIKDLQEGRNGQFLALGSATGWEQVVPEANPNRGCVIIYRGVTRGEPGGEVSATAPETSGKLTKAMLQALQLEDYPAFYLEAEVYTLPSGEGSSLVLKPVYIHYAASAAKYVGSGRKTVTVALAMGRAQPATAGTDEGVTKDAPQVYRFNLGRLKIGEFYAGGTDLQSASPRTEVIGTNMAALVTESEDPSIALGALATAFSDKKGDIAKAVNDAVTGALSE